MILISIAHFYLKQKTEFGGGKKSIIKPNLGEKQKLISQGPLGKKLTCDVVHRGPGSLYDFIKVHL